MNLCVWRNTKSFGGLEASSEVMAGTNFFPNWLGDFAIQDGDCCFPPTRPARSLDRSDPTRTRRTALMEEERIEGNEQGIKHTRRRGREPRGRLWAGGSKSPGLCFKPRDDTLYSLESDIRQTLVTLYAIHALETSRDRSWIDLERPEKPPVTL
jgi:hypothetical protein